MSPDWVSVNNAVTATLTGCFFFLLATGAAIAQGNTPQVDYTLQCMGCHMADGRGIPGVVPDMRGFVGRFLHVEGGRKYLVSVPGVAQAPLDDRKLAELMNWLLREFSADELPADFVPYTDGEVSHYRRQVLLDIKDHRQSLVEGMPEAIPSKQR